MLTSIKGFYEKGQVILKEDPHIATRTEVIVTFLSEGQPKVQPKSTLGLLEGKIRVSDDFNGPLDDLKEYM